MPVFHSADVEPFRMHGSTFESVVRPARGSTGLCAWRLTVAPGSVGTSHRPSHEEVMLVLEENSPSTSTMTPPLPARAMSCSSRRRRSCGWTAVRMGRSPG